MDRGGPGLGARMYRREDVELALEGLAEGMSVREACEMVGCRGSAVRGWAAGRLPRPCTGAPSPGRGRMAPLPGEGGEGAVTDGEGAAHEAAMTESQLLGAVLDDLKGEGCAPRSISSGRKAEFGERLRRETGLPLRGIAAFPGVSKSPHWYQGARLGEGRDAALGAPSARRSRGARLLRPPPRQRPAAPARHAGLREARPARDARGGLVAARPRRRRHDFSAGAPGELAAADVSGLPATGRKYYLSPVIDCRDGLPASWGLSRHPDSALRDGSLEAYLGSPPGGSSPVVRTDGGGPYRAAGWRGVCSRRGAARSMPRPGRCGDNARAEGLSGALKVEFPYRRDWSRASPGEFRSALADHVEWYRDGRLRLFVGPDGTRHYETIMGRRRRLGPAG